MLRRLRGNICWIIALLRKNLIVFFIRHANNILRKAEVSGWDRCMGSLHFADPQAMDPHDALPKWTTLIDCQMDYPGGLPSKLP